MFTTTDALPGSRRGTALVRALSVVFVAALVFATLYPLVDWRLRAPGAFAFIARGLPRYWTWFDLLGNLLGYLVLGLLLTLGWLEHARRWPAIVAVTLAGSALSLSLEAMQSYLPGRVPSLLDWLSNSVGVLAGAWLGTLLNRTGRRTDRIALPVSDRWFEQGPPTGWVLLLAWLAAQLVPQRLLFATGYVAPGLQRLADGLLHAEPLELTTRSAGLWSSATTAGYGVAIEAGVVVCATCTIGALAFALVHGTSRRLLLLAGIATIAFGLRSIASQMVYGPDAPFAWLTPGAQGGLVVGMALLYGLETLGPRARAAIAMATTVLGFVLANLAPQDRYFDTTLAGLEAGQLSNLHGLLRSVSLVWPAIALVWFWRRAGSTRARSL
jgi:VanZ family protein